MADKEEMDLAQDLNLSKFERELIEKYRNLHSRNAIVFDSVINWLVALLRLFDQQMETLVSRGCPVQIVEDFADQKDRVIALALGLDSETEIPFLPVIPLNYLGVAGLMSLICHNEKKGCVSGELWVDKISNRIFTDLNFPRRPYFIFGVRKDADSGNRCHLLNFDETVALCVHQASIFESNGTEVLCSLASYLGVFRAEGQLSIVMDWDQGPFLVSKVSYLDSGALVPACDFRRDFND